MATSNDQLEIELPPAASQTIPNNGSEHETMVQNLSDRISSLQKSAFTLANYYFISQAVVFTALSTSDSLVCHNFWFPMFPSLLPGGLNLVAFFKIGEEYIETKIFHKKYQALSRTHRSADSAQTHVILLFDDANNMIGDEIDKKRLTRYLWRFMYAFGFLAAVVAVGSVWMLCEKNIIFIFKSIIFKPKHNAK